MLERHVEDYFVACVKTRGGDVRKVKWIGRKHAPDRLALLPGQHFYAELKRPGKGARDGQQREHQRMRAAGCRVYVLNDLNIVKGFFHTLDNGESLDAFR